MKYLFSCSNPYQIMVAALLRMQFVADYDQADLIITDTFAGYAKIVERINETNFFRNVFVANVKNIIIPRNRTDKYNKVAFFLNYKKRLPKLKSTYDYFFYNNEDIYTYNMITFLKINNSKCCVCRFEEGYSSYTNLNSASFKSQCAIKIRNFFLKNVSIKNDYFYVFEPDLLMRKYTEAVTKIERKHIMEESYKKFVSYIFQVDKTMKTYDKPYVIFEESFVADGFDIDDLNVYKKIINYFGKNNFTVKMHPRSLRNRFENIVDDVKIPDGIPWEAIALNIDRDNLILLALGSGSVINSRLLLGNSIKAVLLFECLELRPPAFNEYFIVFIKKFCEKYGDNVYVPHNIEEALKILHE